jgi:hypothetical protein
MTALQDESVQKLGIVVVWNIMSEYSGGHDYEADRMAIKTITALPIRPVARYIIFQCMLWNQVIEVLNHLISPHLRARTRSIHGNCRFYGLMDGFLLHLLYVQILIWLSIYSYFYSSSRIL